MKRDPKERFDKVTLNLRKGDADFLAEHFPIGYSAAIRGLVAAYVDRVVAAKGAVMQEPERVEI
jgi:hypothetical protein